MAKALLWASSHVGSAGSSVIERNEITTIGSAGLFDEQDCVRHQLEICSTVSSCAYLDEQLQA